MKLWTEKINILEIFVLAIILFFGFGCTKVEKYYEAPKAQGGSSGGGGFGDEASLKILERASQDLAAQIRNASPGMFETLPKSWDQQRLAKLIEEVRTDFGLPVVRYGRELMFDNRTNERGEPYLVATVLYRNSHSAIPVNHLKYWDLQVYIDEVKLKLLHEAAHHLGIGLTEKSDPMARRFAETLTASLKSDIVMCFAPAVACERYRWDHNVKKCKNGERPFDVKNSKFAFWQFNRTSRLGTAFDIFYRPSHIEEDLMFASDEIPNRSGKFFNFEEHVRHLVDIMVDWRMTEIDVTPLDYLDLEEGVRSELNLEFPFYYPFTPELHNHWSFNQPESFYIHDWEFVTSDETTLVVETPRKQISYFVALVDSQEGSTPHREEFNFETPLSGHTEYEKRLQLENRFQLKDGEFSLDRVERTEKWFQEKLELKFDGDVVVSAEATVLEWEQILPVLAQSGH